MYEDPCCPICSVFILLVSTTNSSSSMPLLRCKNGLKLTYEGFIREAKYQAEAWKHHSWPVSLVSGGFGTHSCRRAGAQFHFVQGLDRARNTVLARWATDAIDKYIEEISGLGFGPQMYPGFQHRSIEALNYQFAQLSAQLQSQNKMLVPAHEATASTQPCTSTQFTQTENASLTQLTHDLPERQDAVQQPSLTHGDAEILIAVSGKIIHKVDDNLGWRCRAGVNKNALVVTPTSRFDELIGHCPKCCH